MLTMVKFSQGKSSKRITVAAFLHTRYLCCSRNSGVRALKADMNQLVINVNNKCNIVSFVTGLFDVGVLC